MTFKDFMTCLALVILIAVIPGIARSAWDPSGNPVCVQTGHQWYPASVPDGQGGAIVIWQDYSTTSGDILLQRLDEGGAHLWGTEAVPVCQVSSSREFFRQALPDGSGGVIVAWTDHRSGTVDIYLQRVDSGGSIAWTTSGTQVSSDGTDDFYPVMCSSGSGEVFLAWQRGADSSSNVLVQKMGMDGVADWAAGGIPVSGGAGQFMPSIISDGSGGVIIQWTEGDAGTGVIMAQRLDQDGVFQWGSSGRTVCDLGYVTGVPSICSDGAGGLLVVWEDMRNSDRDIYAQRLDSSGDPQWSTGGAVVASGTGEQWFPQMLSDEAGGFFTVWVDDSSGDHDLRVQRMSPTGSRMWTPVGTVVCSEPGSQLNPRIVAAVGSSCIIAWQDDRSGDYDIYAQKIDGSGGVEWAEGGSPVLVAAGDQRLPELFEDSAGGAIVTWEHWDSESDIYSLHIGPDGQYLATELAGFSSSVSSRGIELDWSMSESEENMVFHVFRADADGSGEADDAGTVDDISESMDGFIPLDGQVDETGISEYRYFDETAQSGREYVYRVSVTGEEGTRVLFETETLRMPRLENVVRQNYPNPFNPVTTISYDLAERSVVELSIFDVSGRRVSMLVRGVEEAGEHRAVWNGCDDNGSSVASGVYFYKLRADKEVFTRKMVLLR